MTERVTHQARVEQIDRVVRELTWHGQKHAIQTLTRPDIELTLPQMITLLAIHDHTTCRMGELADATQQSGGTLTGIVDRLIDDGLVERVRGVSDRRVIEVALTREGQKRVQQVLAVRRDDLQRILQIFDDDELEQFANLLNRFLQSVRGVLPSPDGE